MKEARHKWYIYLVLFIVVITYVVFIFDKNSDKETKLETVKLKDEINEKSKNSFAIMVEKENGSEYEEVDDFPSGLPLNTELTGCIDIDGKSLENAISYSNGVVTVNVNSTAYCYLYFDIDGVAPESFTFYVGGSSNPTYVTSTNPTTYLSWDDTDIAYYCITNIQGSDNCNWQSTGGTSITPTHTLITGDGTKTVYAYIKDASGNISPEVNDTIILDSTKPTITNVTKTSDEQTSITISVSASDDTSKIKTYYYKIGSGSYTSSTSSTYTFTGLAKGTTYSISVYVVDNAELQSDVATYSYETKSNPTISEQILSNPTTGLNTTLEGGLYRYQGTSVDNYICFGTSDKNTCTGNTDAYLYRIIGITENGRLKLIKNYGLSNTMQWHSSKTTNTTWPNSDLYKALNGSTFLTNTTYVPSSWEDIIDDNLWKYGNNTNGNTTAANLYAIENTWTDTIDAKIGLMYLHDYYYAYQSGGLNCSNSGSYNECAKSWIFLKNCDSTATLKDDWTMSCYGYYTSSSSSEKGYHAWSIRFAYYSMSNTLDTTNTIRPVFYLKSDIQLSGGTGTSSNPFLIQ